MSSPDEVKQLYEVYMAYERESRIAEAKRRAAWAAYERAWSEMRHGPSLPPVAEE